ncbi:MAG TPA: hypothetical protein VFJ93_14055 [Gaiellaceae bacterium]|nr:hypothetical protein [Gaiellaceae bacterium]
MHVTFVVPAEKSVPFGVGHETMISLGESSGSVAETENDTFVQNVVPHPAVASATMLPGPEITGGVVSAALRAAAPSAEPGIATRPAANRRLSTTLMAPTLRRRTRGAIGIGNLDWLGAANA